MQRQRRTPQTFLNLQKSILCLILMVTLPLSGGTNADRKPTLVELALIEALSAYAGNYDLSGAAMATAVKDETGANIGVFAYEEPIDAIKAGDTAAFLVAIKTELARTGEIRPIARFALSIDHAAAGDYDKAITQIEPLLDDAQSKDFGGFVSAWFWALSGQPDQAIRQHREIAQNLPGLTGDLSLAGLLESVGRTDEALAVYAAITPSEIIAPKHRFDPQALIFSHIRMVISRQTLLLRRDGQLEQAQSLYRKLAAAEPERAVAYQAAIESLATGRGLENGHVTPEAAFSRALTDYALSLSFQRRLSGALTFDSANSLDETTAVFYQLALLVDPANDALRLNAYEGLFDATLYDGALHILRSAPEPSARLKMAEALTLLRIDDYEAAALAIESSLSLAPEDQRLEIYSGAMRIYALLKKQGRALELASMLPEFALSDADMAMAYGLSSAIYSQFGQFDEALENARAAKRIDDTHERRLALADALANAGETDAGLLILRTEALNRPNDPYMLNTLGYYLILHTNRLEEAFQVLARASILAPNDPYISDSFGWVRYKMGDLEGALRYIQHSRTILAPQKNWEVEDHIGDIYWHLGRHDEARQAWTAALEEYPPQEQRSLIVEKLSDGLSDPPPAIIPLPNLSLSRDGQVDRQDI